MASATNTSQLLPTTLDDPSSSLLPTTTSDPTDGITDQDITNAGSLDTSLLDTGDSTESSLDSILADMGLSGSSSSSSSSGDSSTLGDVGTFLSDLGSTFTSALESPLGELALYGGLAAYGLNSASEAQQQTQSEANQITSASQPYLNAGNTLLSEYQSGTLPSWAQSTVNFDTTEGQDIINSGQGLQTIANQNLAQYSSGQLKPADQLALDQQTSAQTQQVMSQLGAGGTVDSSVAAAYTQQIQQNAQITKQNILNSYYTTGDQAYNSWLTSTTEGANLINQGGQFAQTTFNQMMTGALGLSDIGMQGLTTAIGLEIQSDTALSQEVSTLMSNLASAYAYTLAGPGRSGTTGTGVTGTSGTLGVVGSALNTLNAGNNLLNDLSGYSSLGSAAASDSSAATSLVNSELGNVSSLGDVGDNDLSSLMSSEGLSDSTVYGDLSDLSQPAVSGAASAGASAAGAAAGTAGSAAASAAGALPAGVTPAISDAATAAELDANSGALTADLGSDAGSQAGTAGGSASGALGDAGTVLGALGTAYSLYNTIENWQSGSTGSDALNGAETGAAVGTMVLPGIGTAIGAVIGGAVGAISSAFGGGKTDPETLNWDKVAGQLASNPSIANSFTPAQSYQMLAGVMDAKNNTAGHSEAIEQVFGREGEGNLMTQMTTQINSAITSGKISKTATPAQIYQQVVAPWLASKNASINPNQMTSNGQPEGQALPYVLQRLIGLWQAGNLTSTTPVGVSGQTIQGLPTYGA